MKQTIIRTYSGFFSTSAAKKFERDAEKLAKQGYVIHSQSASGSGPFVNRIITVVYQLAKPA